MAVSNPAATGLEFIKENPCQWISQNQDISKNEEFIQFNEIFIQNLGSLSRIPRSSFVEKLSKHSAINNKSIRLRLINLYKEKFKSNIDKELSPKRTRKPTLICN